jgi:hypothetical protein
MVFFFPYKGKLVRNPPEDDPEAEAEFHLARQETARLAKNANERVASARRNAARAAQQPNFFLQGGVAAAFSPVAAQTTPKPRAVLSATPAALAHGEPMSSTPRAQSPALQPLASMDDGAHQASRVLEAPEPWFPVALELSPPPPPTLYPDPSWPHEQYVIEFAHAIQQAGRGLRSLVMLTGAGSSHDINDLTGPSYAARGPSPCCYPVAALTLGGATLITTNHDTTYRIFPGIDVPGVKGAQGEVHEVHGMIDFVCCSHRLCPKIFSIGGLGCPDHPGREAGRTAVRVDNSPYYPAYDAAFKKIDELPTPRFLVILGVGGKIQTPRLIKLVNKFDRVAYVNTATKLTAFGGEASKGPWGTHVNSDTTYFLKRLRFHLNDQSSSLDDTEAARSCASPDVLPDPSSMKYRERCFKLCRQKYGANLGANNSFFFPIYTGLLRGSW